MDIESARTNRTDTQMADRQQIQSKGQNDLVQSNKVGSSEQWNSQAPGSVDAVFESEYFGQGQLADSIYKGNDGTYYVNVVVMDPKTREPINLQGIRLTQVHDTGIPRVQPGTTVSISYQNARDIAQRDVAKMTGQLVLPNFGAANTAIPSDMLRRNRRAVAAASARRVCNLGGKFDFNYEAGRLFDKTTLAMMTDVANNRAPGIATDSATGDMTMFHKSGNQMTFNGKGIEIDASKFSTGASKRSGQELSSGGLPADEHPLRNLYPSSNILLNIPVPVVPWLVSIADMMTFVVLVYKIFKVGQIAVTYIADGGSSNKNFNSNQNVRSSILNDFKQVGNQQ